MGLALPVTHLSQRTSLSQRTVRTQPRSPLQPLSPLHSLTTSATNKRKNGPIVSTCEQWDHSGYKWFQVVLIVLS